MVEAMMGLIQRAFDEPISRQRPQNNKRTVYWWTEDIATLRKKCLQLRRKTQRARRIGREFDVRTAEHKIAKKRNCANLIGDTTNFVGKHP